jgi:hypothetical protein
MAFVAIKMLTGDLSKDIGVIFAIRFASMLMAHRASIFGNIMWRTTTQIQDVRGAGMGVSSGPCGSIKGRPGGQNVARPGAGRDHEPLRCVGPPAHLLP